jgi:thioredoxin-like negative regulator of GroEL
MGVMEINGILAKQIFDYNNWKHEFFVEESYVIAWMYPYLTPHGLIMKINRDRQPGLSPENVQDDLDFWDWYTRRFVENRWFVRDVVARKSFSKLRSAIAGLYGYRGMQKEAIQAFNEALTLYPLSPEANFRLAEIYMRTGQFDKARELMESFGEMDPANDKVEGFLKQIDGIEALNAEIQKIEGELRTDKQPDAQKVLRLASLYLQGGRVDRFVQVSAGLLQSPQMPSFILLPLASMYDQANRPTEMNQALTLCLERMPPQAPAKELLTIAQLFGKRNNANGMRKALKAYLARQPNDWRIWLQVATLDVQAKDQEAATSSLGMAVRYGGGDAQRAIQQNRLLAPIWQQRAQRTQGLLGL